MRNEPIDQDKFNHVMKKLDINDLVIPQKERQELFQQFANPQGQFNAEALFSAIIEQKNIERPLFPPKLSDFDDNLRTQEEVQAKKSKRATYFDFRRTPNLQFEHQFLRAQLVLNELKQLGEEAKSIVAKKGGSLTKQ